MQSECSIKFKSCMQSVIKTENPFLIGAPEIQITRFFVVSDGKILSHLEGISRIGALYARYFLQNGLYETILASCPLSIFSFLQNLLNSPRDQLIFVASLDLMLRRYVSLVFTSFTVYRLRQCKGIRKHNALKGSVFLCVHNIMESFFDVNCRNIICK